MSTAYLPSRFEFVPRQGAEPYGIVASGWATSKVYQKPHGQRHKLRAGKPCPAPCLPKLPCHAVLAQPSTPHRRAKGNLELQEKETLAFASAAHDLFLIVCSSLRCIVASLR